MAQTLIGPSLTQVADRPHGRETGFWEVTKSSSGQMTGNPQVVRDSPYKLSQRKKIGRTHKFSAKTATFGCDRVLLYEKSFSKLIPAHEGLHGAESIEQILNFAVLVNLLGRTKYVRGDDLQGV